MNYYHNNFQIIFKIALEIKTNINSGTWPDDRNLKVSYS